MTPSPSATPQTPPDAASRVVHGRVAAAVIAAVIVFAAVGAVIWYLDSDDSTQSSTTTTTQSSAAPSTSVPGIGPKIVSPAALGELARSSGRPVYWAGRRDGAPIEYTRRTDGATFVRYLTGGAKPGNRSAGYIVVATYAQPDAFRRVSAIASRNHLAVKRLESGGIAVTRRGRPNNIYLVYPNLPYQVEVYAPSPAQARHLVSTGVIGPVR